MCLSTNPSTKVFSTPAAMSPHWRQLGGPCNISGNSVATCIQIKSPQGEQRADKKHTTHMCQGKG